MTVIVVETGNYPLIEFHGTSFVIVSMKYVNYRIYICVFLLIAGVHECFAADVENNLSLLNSVTDSIVQTLIRQHIPDGVDTITVRGIGPADETQWYFASRLAQALMATGAIVKKAELRSHSTESIAPPALVLEYQILQLGVSYRIVNTSFFNRQLERTITGRVRFLLADAISGKIGWLGELSHSYIDSLEYSQKDDVERSLPSFARGASPGQFGWRELVDAILVTVSSGIVIYTFYAYRSK